MPPDPVSHEEPMNEKRLTLPWPPSVNHYWRTARGNTYISAAGKTYRSLVTRVASIDTPECVRCNVPMLGRLAVDVLAYQADARRRDVDNLLKALLDALAYARVYDDDSQIDELRVSRFFARGDELAGTVRVTVRGLS